MIRFAAAALLAVMLTAAANAQTIVGWRGDGTGLYPNATPPTEWGRFPKSPVHGMLSSIVKPAGADAGANARPLEFNLVREWLMIGPFPADAKDALAQEYLADEANLQPVESDKVGELAWKKAVALKRDGDMQQGTELDWIYFNDVCGGKGANFAYAFTRLYAPTAGQVVLVFDHGGALKMWVNGKEVYSQAKGSLSIWAINNISWGWGCYYPTPFGVTAKRVTVTLDKGWNRVLLKSNGNVQLRLTPTPDAEYENKNIVWMSEMPDASNASPIIVGDKIFVTAEPDELVCINKTDGKILWRRSNSFFDAVPEAERAANPAYAKIAELMQKRMAAKTFAEKIVLRKQIDDALIAIDKDKFTMSIEGHPTSHRPLAGWATPTPFSDGKSVYISVTNGVAACYDLDGNRKWITRVDLILRNPGEQYGPYQYPCSPVLFGGKFVCAVLYHGMAALNAADGALSWVNRDVKSSMICLNAGVVGGEKVILGSAGEAIRLSDGKILWSNKWNSSAGPATFIDPVLYVQYLGYVAIDYSKCKPGEFAPTIAPFQGAPGYTTFTAPLVHDGLLYYLDRTGELAVLDVNAKSAAYRKKLDVLPLLNYLAAGMCSAPTLGGKNVYLMDNQGTGIVIAPGREYKEIARNRLETILDLDFPLAPQETCYSNPVFEGSRMYVRAEKYLYCIAEK